MGGRQVGGRRVGGRRVGSGTTTTPTYQPSNLPTNQPTNLTIPISLQMTMTNTEYRTGDHRSAAPDFLAGNQLYDPFGHGHG